MKIIRENSLPEINSFSFAGAFAEKKRDTLDCSMISNYKLSKYNIVQHYGDTVVVYNMASDAIVIATRDEINNLFETSIENVVITDEILKCFVYQGILVPVNLDEDLRLSIVRQNQITNPDNELKIAINTTYGCNARCDYCFECDADHSKMSYETADSVADYICKSVNENTLLTYRWFGGEPLLAVDIIDRIIARVNAYFNNKLNYI